MPPESPIPETPVSLAASTTPTVVELKIDYLRDDFVEFKKEFKAELASIRTDNKADIQSIRDCLVGWDKIYRGNGVKGYNERVGDLEKWQSHITGTLRWFGLPLAITLTTGTLLFIWGLLTNVVEIIIHK